MVYFPELNEHSALIPYIPLKCLAVVDRVGTSYIKLFLHIQKRTELTDHQH